eukprot:TRINITY_DN279_c0_g1_i1.p1 TRINITY_DN279_c0_g1~~TRINITY_DN279_c0_g1_i1.p1  ORF type:complete len:370 (+),score=103.94 TRINITY_DN279_c0_g1_i1:53-1162(+)
MSGSRGVTEGMGNRGSMHDVAGVRAGFEEDLPKEYAIKDAIGFGSYGMVCSAEVRGERVAIKKICNLFHDGGDCKRILREIKLLKHLKHPNILSLKAILLGKTAAEMDTYNQIFLVTDLLDIDLHSVIKSEQALAPTHVSYITWQLLKGLDYLHKCQVMHRDIKPANILVNRNCDLKICDFGLARGRSSHTQELTEYVVTRWYRAPEILLYCPEYGTGIDIWSAGCVVAEMVEKKPLWPGSDYINQITLIAETCGPRSLSWSKEASRFFSLHTATMQHKPLSVLLPSHHQHGELLPFLSLLLRPDPATRLSAGDLLDHPYLAHHHDAYEAQLHASYAPKPFRWKIDTDTFSTDFTEAELRSAIWKEVSS